MQFSKKFATLTKAILRGVSPFHENAPKAAPSNAAPIVTFKGCSISRPLYTPITPELCAHFNGSRPARTSFIALSPMHRFSLTKTSSLPSTAQASLETSPSLPRQPSVDWDDTASAESDYSESGSSEWPSSVETVSEQPVEEADYPEVSEYRMSCDFEPVEVRRMLYCNSDLDLRSSRPWHCTDVSLQMGMDL